jgi:hypothetical protein
VGDPVDVMAIDLRSVKHTERVAENSFDGLGTVEVHWR